MKEVLTEVKMFGIKKIGLDYYKFMRKSSWVTPLFGITAIFGICMSWAYLSVYPYNILFYIPWVIVLLYGIYFILRYD